MLVPGACDACPILILCTNLLSTFTASVLMASVKAVSVISATSVPGLARRISSFRSLSRQLNRNTGDWVVVIPMPVLNMDQFLRKCSQVSWSDPAESFGASSLALEFDAVRGAGAEVEWVLSAWIFSRASLSAKACPGSHCESVL